jgi:ferrous iron transport protein B
MTTQTVRVALAGSPNSGKTSLFNSLTGLRRKVANFAGVTVDCVEGAVKTPGGEVTLLDLPGTYSTEALSLDEQVAMQVLRQQAAGVGALDAVLIVADATTLRRSLPMVMELLELGIPSALALTMVDEMKARGGAVDVPQLRRQLGIPVFGVVGHRGIGVDEVRAELDRAKAWPARSVGSVVDASTDAVAQRFAESDRILDAVLREPERRSELTDRIDRVVLHPVWGSAVFALTMLLFFQITFTVAAPLQDALEGLVVSLGTALVSIVPDGVIRSLLVDGVVAGVGGVVVFVPQIALLLLLIAVLEGCGYMPRAAFLVDRVMGRVGLEGRSFVALLSSYACAVPGIMATRAVPDVRTRLATILVAPFMTCSARLPVYGLLIGAFVPAVTVGGVFQLQGLVLFALYVLGAVTALLAAWVLQRRAPKSAIYPFYMELPPYRWPTNKVLLQQVWQGVSGFLRRAGTLILVVSVVLWVLLSFPAAPDGTLGGDVSHSWAAWLGHLIEPVIRPLGFDWRIGIGLVASLAAREVIVATLAQIYAFEGGEDDLVGLGAQLRALTTDGGEAAYTLATALSLMVFFVFALQCVSTLAVMKRETGSWKWPAAAFGAMFVLAWVASFVTYQGARLLGW